MEDQKIKIQNPTDGKIVDAIHVDIKESSELSNKITLKDGTILDIKLVISRVARVPDQWDIDGNPFYIVKHSNIITVLNSPDNLRKG